MDSCEEKSIVTYCNFDSFFLVRVVADDVIDVKC